MCVPYDTYANMYSNMFILFSVVISTINVISGDTSLLRNTYQERIYKGQYAAEGQFPSVVYIAASDKDGNYTACVGSIIHRQWILTAAHCVKWYTDIIWIRAGSTVSNSGGQTYKLTEWFIHEDYINSSLHDDIALLKLPTPIEINNNVQTIVLDTRDEIEIGSECIGLGWGYYTYPIPSTMLKFHHARIISHRECLQRSLYSGEYAVYPIHICSLDLEGGATCEGDSGSPLICNNKQVGILNMGGYPCNSNHPNVYCPVSKYLDWINKTMSAN